MLRGQPDGLVLTAAGAGALAMGSGAPAGAAGDEGAVLSRPGRPVAVRASAGRVPGCAGVTCAHCGAADGLALDGGRRFRVSRGADALCCIGPDDPWLPALRRREAGGLRLCGSGRDGGDGGPAAA